MSNVMKFLGLKEPLVVIDDPKGYKKGTEFLIDNNYHVFYKNPYGFFKQVKSNNFKFINNCHFPDVKFKLLGRTKTTFYLLKSGDFDECLTVEKERWCENYSNTFGGKSSYIRFNVPNINIHFTGYVDPIKFLEANIKRLVYDEINNFVKNVATPTLFRNNNGTNYDEVDYDLNDKDEVSMYLASLLASKIKSTLSSFLKTPVVIFEGLKISNIPVDALVLAEQPVLPLFNGHLNLLGRALYAASHNNVKEASEFLYTKALNAPGSFKERGEYIKDNVVNPLLNAQSALRKGIFSSQEEADAYKAVFRIGLNIYYIMNIFDDVKDLNANNAPREITKALQENLMENKVAFSNANPTDFKLTQALVDSVSSSNGYEKNVHLLDATFTKLGY